MKKCPECDLNYIKDSEVICSICAEQINGRNSIQNHKARSYRGAKGFKAYNSKGQNVGIVYMTNDKRVSAYGYCELCFYEEYHNRYGEWHRFTSHGQKIKWEYMVQQLNQNTIYKCYID